MKTEVEAAVNFLTNMLRTGNVPADRLEKFNTLLITSLIKHYQDHWFVEKPNKGSAYRCIRINGTMDELVKRSSIESGITNIRTHFPSELTLWVDPQEVSYRIGEEGSIGVLYEVPKPKARSTPTKQNTITPRRGSPVHIVDPATNDSVIFHSPQRQSPTMNRMSPYSTEQYNNGYISYNSCSDEANRNSPTITQGYSAVDFRHLAAYVSS